MKNIIYYYYNIKIDKIYNKNKNYYFYYNSHLYYLLLYTQNPNIINNIYHLSVSIIPNITHKIIKNNKNDVITQIDNNAYILLIINQNIPSKISIKEIYNFENLNYFKDNKMIRNAWNELWSYKIDYLERQINEIGRKYPVLVDSFSYFVGLAENAISYYQNTIDSYPQNNSYALTHDKLTSNNLDFYNPLNIIIDHKARDIAEYIKLSFYTQNYSIFEELNTYFSINHYTEYDIRILISRIIYPSYYFDLYDNIINNIIKEDDITYITQNINEYEDYIKNILKYLEQYYKFPNIDWLK